MRDAAAGLTLDADSGRDRGLPAPDPPHPRTSASSSSCGCGCRPSRLRQRDRDYQQRFAPLGLLDARAAASADPDPELAAGLAAGTRADGSSARPRAQSPEQNGWKLDLPRVRLQPRLLRGGRARRGALEDAPTAPGVTSSARSRPAAGCGATTATRRPTRWSTTTATAGNSTARHRYELRFDGHAAGRRVLVGDDVRHCPTSTWSRTRSIATRSATVPLACDYGPTAR